MVVPHRDGLLSQNKTGWTTRATRRPRFPAPKQIMRGELAIQFFKMLLSPLQQSLVGADWELSKSAFSA